MQRVRSLWLLVAVAAVAASSGAWGQAYPSRPVRVIVSAAAGGPSDVIGRIVAQKLSERLGQQFYVENIPAGAGNLAVGMVAKAAPDGYTLLSPTSAVVVNPSLYANLPYDTLKDFAPVTLAAASPHVLTVNPDLPVHSVAESFLTSATAHAGPMLECDCSGHSYSASITRCAPFNAASTSPILTGVPLPVAFALRM